MLKSVPLQFVAIALCAGVALGQQFGDADRDYTVNFNGSYQPSFVPVSICVGQESMTNSYYTSAPNMPFIWAMAPAGTIGWFTNPGNSVDVGPAGLTFLLNGTDLSNPTNLFAQLDPFGGTYLNLGVPALLTGSVLYFCMAHITPSAPSGFYVSQTAQVTFTSPAGASTPTVGANPGTNPNGSATPVPLTDDSFTTLALNGGGFPWYGTTYAQCFVGSNGYVTFGAGDTTYSFNVFGFSSGSPRIAFNWNDMNPGAGGTVQVFADASGGFEVTFTNVPEFFSTGSNTMQIQALVGGALYMNYDSAMSLTDGLVGVSPGNGGTVSSVDLSTPPGGSNLISANQGIYEEFGVALCGSSFDLAGYGLVFTLDASGNPLIQN